LQVLNLVSAFIFLDCHISSFAEFPSFWNGTLVILQELSTFVKQFECRELIAKRKREVHIANTNSFLGVMEKPRERCEKKR